MVKGITRKVDELGRITIPKEYLKTYGVQAGDPLGMLLDGNKAVLIKPGDTFIGIERNLDHLGRYTLPIEVRRTLGFTDRQEVDIFIDRENDAISICKVEYGCCWCGSSEGLIEVDGHHLCGKCAMAVCDKVLEA
jgi:transcriptional pleiotropic regulator of transition state genes